MPAVETTLMCNIAHRHSQKIYLPDICDLNAA